MNQQVVYQDISQIHPYENNPRNNEAAIEPVAQSIKEFGFRVPILIDGKGTIIAGHTRYEAAKRLGMDKVPCIRVDDLTDAQIKEMENMEPFYLADTKVEMIDNTKRAQRDMEFAPQHSGRKNHMKGQAIVIFRAFRNQSICLWKRIKGYAIMSIKNRARCSEKKK